GAAAGHLGPNLLQAWREKIRVGGPTRASIDDTHEVVVLALALVMKKLLLDAAEVSHEPLDHVIAAVPVEWSPDEVACLGAAARVAGIQTLGVVSDARAALAYHHLLDDTREGLIAIVDLGSERAVVTVVNRSQARLQVLSSSTVAGCAGHAFDAAMEALLAAE